MMTPLPRGSCLAYFEESQVTKWVTKQVTIRHHNTPSNTLSNGLIMRIL